MFTYLKPQTVNSTFISESLLCYTIQVMIMHTFKNLICILFYNVGNTEKEE